MSGIWTHRRASVDDDGGGRDRRARYLLSGASKEWTRGSLLSRASVDDDDDDDDGRERHRNAHDGAPADDLCLSDVDDRGVPAALSSTRQWPFLDRATGPSADVGRGGAFELGDDGDYESEQRGTSPGTATLADEDVDDADDAAASSHKGEAVNAYRGHLKNIRDGGCKSYVDAVRGKSQGTATLAAEDAGDAADASASSQTGEAVNNYRGHFEKIRDGGFESYLDADGAAARGADGRGTDGAGDLDALERALNVLEERATLHDDVCLSQNVRASAARSLRAKVQALLRQEEKRGRAKHRQQRNDAVEAGDIGWRRPPPVVWQSLRARAACVGVCLVLALAAGLSLRGKEDGAKEGGAVVMATTETALAKAEDAEGERDAAGHLAAQQREKAVIAAFQPVWFSAAQGWSGGSYEEGFLFCESYHHMVLCPLEAYCPHGPARPPLPGSMVLDPYGAEEWAPANGPLNTWIQIGTLDGDESTRCTLPHTPLGERPQWGMNGDRSEVKHHILCCRF